LALVSDLHGSKAAVLVGFEAKPERLPLRDLDLIAPLPPGAAPAASLGALPWHISAAALTAATPSRRDLAAAWLLLEGDDGPMALDALVDPLALKAAAQGRHLFLASANAGGRIGDLINPELPLPAAQPPR
jgi:hypothetical protein